MLYLLLTAIPKRKIAVAQCYDEMSILLNLVQLMNPYTHQLINQKINLPTTHDHPDEKPTPSPQYSPSQTHPLSQDSQTPYAAHAEPSHPSSNQNI
jgi:hypothetical protein